MELLICPRCEKNLGLEHDDKACERKVSRRFFFGVAFGGIMAAVAKEAPTPQFVRPLLFVRPEFFKFPPRSQLGSVAPPTYDNIFKESPVFTKLADGTRLKGFHSDAAIKRLLKKNP